MAKNKRQARREFAEDFGILSETVGFPCMAGRIWGWLLTADPPHQTAAEIADGVSASRGSVSTMTGLLMQLGLVERVGIPGKRGKFYRVRRDGFTEVLRKRMRLMTEVRRMAERGLELVKGDPPAVREHLEEYAALCAFIEGEVPALIGKWEEQRKRFRK